MGTQRNAGYHPSYAAYLAQKVGKDWLDQMRERQAGFTPEFVHLWTQANSPNFEKLVRIVLDDVYGIGGKHEEQRGTDDLGLASGRNN